MKNKVMAFAILIIGLVLSVVLHELFHVLLHIGHIQHIDVFPNNGNIAQVVVDYQAGYNLALEEAFAYGITITLMLVTLVIFFLKMTERKK